MTDGRQTGTKNYGRQTGTKNGGKWADMTI